MSIGPHPNSVVTWRADAKAATLEAENAQLRAACWAARGYIVQAIGQLDSAGYEVIAQCDAAVGHDVPGVDTPHPMPTDGRCVAPAANETAIRGR